MSKTVLFHTHGIGPFDFSVMDGESLPALNRLATERSVLLCPTLFLAAERIDAFEDLLRCYTRLKRRGEVDHILGFGIEGPLLGPNGGSPSRAIWHPTAAQWRRMAEWFSLGLRYFVLAPDIFALQDDIDRSFTFADLLALIYDSGGRIAVGHFDGASPELSTERFNEVMNYIEAGYERSPYLILTDHLFNDMPRAFKHAFRTPNARVHREAELAKHSSSTWQASSLPTLLGPLPAAILVAARDKRLTPALNFDGGHVDLAICRRVVEFLGADRIIAITDHTETFTIAGETLVRDDDTKLLYRPDGVLAASFVTQEEQRLNMQNIGMNTDDINFVQYKTPLAALRFEPCRRVIPQT